MTLALVAIAIAAGWVWLTLRGRRVNEHPICRGCGFDLIGLWPAPPLVEPGKTDDGGREPVVPKCPECGAGLDSPRRIRIGERVRSRRWVTVASLALAASIAFVGGRAWLYTQGQSWRQYAPTWLLVRVAERCVPSTFCSRSRSWHYATRRRH